jgi:hypothetical protein
MDETTARLVPKVHPLARPVEPEDPLVLTATLVAGDPDVMIRAVVQEYGWLGWSADQILSLFRDPFFPVLYGLWQTLGDKEVRARITSVVETSGVFCFRSTIVEPPIDEESEPYDDLALEDGHDDEMPGSGPKQCPSACQESPGDPFVSLEVLFDRSRRLLGRPT